MILFFSLYRNLRIQCIIPNDIDQASVSQRKPYAAKNATSIILITRYSSILSAKITSWFTNYQRDELNWLLFLGLLQCHLKGVVLPGEWITTTSFHIWIFFIVNKSWIFLIVVSSWSDANILPLPVVQLIKLLKEHDSEVLVRC